MLRFYFASFFIFLGISTHALSNHVGQNLLLQVQVEDACLESLRVKPSEAGFAKLQVSFDKQKEFVDVVQKMASQFRNLYDSHRTPPSFQDFKAQASKLEIVESYLELRSQLMTHNWVSALLDIQSDQDYQKRVVEALVAAEPQLTLNSSLKIPFYVRNPKFHHLSYIGADDYAQDGMDWLHGAIFNHGVDRLQMVMELVYQGKKQLTLADVDAHQPTLINFFTKAFVDGLNMSFPDMDPEVVVDIGATVGDSTTILKQRFPDAKVIGVDVSASTMQFAAVRAQFLGLDVSFIQADAEELPFEKETVDLITSSILLHEVPESARINIIKEAARVLKPGGKLLFVDGANYIDPVEGPSKLYVELEKKANVEPYVGTTSLTNLMRYIEDAGLETNEKLSKKFGRPVLVYKQPGSFVVIAAIKPES